MLHSFFGTITIAIIPSFFSDSTHRDSDEETEDIDQGSNNFANINRNVFIENYF